MNYSKSNKQQLKEEELFTLRFPVRRSSFNMVTLSLDHIRYEQLSADISNKQQLESAGSKFYLYTLQTLSQKHIQIILKRALLVSFVVAESIQQFMTKLPYLTELKLYIDKLCLEDLVLLKGVIRILPQLSSFTFGFQVSEDCDQERFRSILVQLADILKDTHEMKRVVVATSNRPEFIRE